MQKILIANRGEIAVRIARACRDMEIASVAVYSDCDRSALHVRLADEAVAIGPSPAVDSYLRVDRIIDAARASGADAVHPGYGFLAENAQLAAACVDAGLTFIGPQADVIALMGSKTEARRAARGAGLPLVPGTLQALSPATNEADLVRLAAETGYPVMVKAVAGGGGKGMRLAKDPNALLGAVRLAQSEAESSFGDGHIYFERWIQRPRHVEVQVLGDLHGMVLPFVERECSVQRRHQKLVEETPSTAVSPEVRQLLTQAAASLATSVGYTNAGTVEFLLDEDGRFYFLEMNTRLQVEHPITEMVTGVDLVQWQIRLARGERLTLDPDALLSPRGHAIECRVYAEDPDADFLPSPGRVEAFDVPHGAGIRDDSGVEAGAEIPIYYDSLISKVVAWGSDREQALARMRRALREYTVTGVRTTVPFVRWLLDQPAFVAGKIHAGGLEEVLQGRGKGPLASGDSSLEEVALIAAALDLAMRAHAADRDPPSAWASLGRCEGLRG
ncbi:MAG TPA: acetyl-CoA carboxylase biotin carboxylase subunit [Vicinamibacterales bacterium]